MDYFIEEEPNNMELFMSTIEPYLINDQVRDLPNDMLYKMIAYYLKSNQTSVLERIVLHLNPANLDPENILVVCEQYSLMTAFCSLNSYIGAYTRPLEAIFALMDANVKDEGLTMYYFYKLMWYSRL